MLRDITSLLRSPQTRVWGLYAHGGQHMFSTILVFTLKFEFYYYSKYWQPFSWRDRSGFEKASAQLPAPVSEEKGVSPQLALVWSLFLEILLFLGNKRFLFLSLRVKRPESALREAPTAPLSTSPG